MTATVTISAVALFAFGATRLAARTFDPRWRRREWYVSAFAVAGAVLGGSLTAVGDGEHPGAALPPSLLCAILGAGAGNIVRILSGPSRERQDPESRQ